MRCDSVAQCIRHLMGQPLYCSAADASCGEREALVMAPPPTCDSAVSPCFHAFLPFPPQAFPTTICSIPSLQSISPQSTAALALGLLYSPLTPASSCCAFQGICLPVQDMHGCSKDCLILIPFRLPQTSCSLLNVSPLTQTIAPKCG